MDLPRMVRLRRRGLAAPLRDPAGAACRALRRAGLLSGLAPNATVAIAVGSRGIAGIQEVVAGLVEEVQQAGLRAFLLPAMGSHGGGTPSGRRKVLAALGITPQAVGAPIRTSPEMIPVATLRSGVPLLSDPWALRADRLLLVNRVRPHTIFTGAIESGLLKMAVLGLGGPEGARLAHHAIRRSGDHEALLREAWGHLQGALPLAGGVALIEGFDHRLLAIRGLASSEVLSQEPALLRWARRVGPRLPVRDLDLLIVDQIGKDLSGSGMDTKLIGRGTFIGEALSTMPRIGLIYVRDLSERSAGNALGMGLADMAHVSLLRKVDMQATLTNALTSGSLEKVRVPAAFGTDREALGAAMEMLGGSGEGLRVLRIANTRDLATVEASLGIAEMARKGRKWLIEGRSRPLRFTAQGDLPG